MRLETQKKLPFQKKNNLCFLFSVFILLIPNVGHSQHFQFKFHNTPVSDALSQVAKTTEIRISFDNGKLENFTTSETIESEQIETILAAILRETGYTFEFKYNTWLIRKIRLNNPIKIPEEKLISGIIFDKSTGERLPYATVYILNKKLAVAATVDGTFSTEVPETEKIFFQLNYLGYQSLDTIILKSESKNTLQFGLTQKAQNIATITVEGDKLEMLDINPRTGQFTINPTQFANLPNYGETDVFKALQLLPGISASENSAALNIRGGSSDQNLVMLDGYTLYNLDHFFGVFSALNSNVIKNIQVYKGGFDARYGERVSGIVDITGKSGNKTKPVFYGGVNLISANLTAEIPISKKITLVAAARRAYSDVYSSWLADALLADKIGQTNRFQEANNIIDPKFHFGDINTKLTYTPNENENISLSIYSAKDYLNSSNLSAENHYTINTKDINEWGNYGFGISWKKRQNAKYFTNLQFGQSGYYNNYANNTDFELAPIDNLRTDLPQNTITNEKNDLVDYFISFKNQYYLNPEHVFEFGVSARYNEFKFYKDATDTLVYTNMKSNAFLYTAYFQDKISIANKLFFTPGFRINYYSKTGKPYFEPRLTVNYKASDKIRIKMASGRYFQFLNKSETEQNYGYSRNFWILADGDSHPIVSSNHFIIGASLETNTNLFFDVETYYKTVDGLQEYLFFQNVSALTKNIAPTNYFKETDLSNFIAGTGKAFGIDFLAKYENTYFTSWLAYSLGKTTRSFKEINHGENIPAEYDQTHELKWTNMYTYNKWNFSMLLLYTTGHPYIKSSEKDEYFTSTRTYDRLPDYFRIDLSANYNFEIKNVHINPGLSILNAMNTENYLDIYVRDFSLNNNTDNETSLIKAQALTFNFFINFKF